MIVIGTYVALVLLVIALLVLWLLASGRAAEEAHRRAVVTADRDRLHTHATGLEIRERHLREQVAGYRRELDAIAGPARPLSVADWAGALREIEAATSPEDFR